MSLADPLIPTMKITTTTDTLNDTPRTFDEAVFENSYKYNNEVEDTDTMAPSPKRARPDGLAPVLPPKSAMRASRLLDNLMLKKMDDTPAVGKKEEGATPMDVYLSSEEDASSDADDFSDYAYDSCSEEDNTACPMKRRGSREDTARVVSVVFSGKPLIVDLNLRRSISPSSIDTRRRSSTASSSASSAKSPTTTERSTTPASAVSETMPVPSFAHPERKSSLVAELIINKRQPFLNIDPYANGSTYSLDIPKSAPPAAAPRVEDSPIKSPMTPTAQLFRGVSRTFSLVRKRSRPMLNSLAGQSQQQKEASPTASLTSASRLSLAVPISAPPTVFEVQEPRQPTRTSTLPIPDLRKPETVEESTKPERPRTAQMSVTYNDIVKAAKKNSKSVVPSLAEACDSPTAIEPRIQQQQQQQLPPPPIPESPVSTASGKRGLLSGFAARRKSINLRGKIIGV